MVKVGSPLRSGQKIPGSSQEGPSTGVSPLSLLLLLVAGTGCPAAHHLAPDLLHELWVLLLHLLCKLLAPAIPRTQTVLPHSCWALLTRPPSCTLPSLLRLSLPFSHTHPPADSLTHPSRECQPLPSHQSHPSSTHAWMRLARSLCCGLLPGVPRGLWPPEIIPDMLQGKKLSTGPQPLPAAPRNSRSSPTATPPFFLRF